MQDSTREIERERREARRNYIALCAVSTVVMAAIVAAATYCSKHSAVRRRDFMQPLGIARQHRSPTTSRGSTSVYCSNRWSDLAGYLTGQTA